MSITFTISKYPSETSGQSLEKLRLEKRLKQGGLAKKLGVHWNSIYECEYDRTKPSTKSMDGLAKSFKISSWKISRWIERKFSEGALARYRVPVA